MSEQQNVSNIHQHGFPFQRHLCFLLTSCFQAGKLSDAISGKASNSSEVHVIQRVHAEARVTYLDAFRNHI